MILINADELKDVVTRLNENGRGITRNEFKLIESVIFEFQTIEPERKTGRWIVMETAYEDTVAKCPECGFETLVNEPGNGLHFLSDLHYCPSCGLPMEVEHENRMED